MCGQVAEPVRGSERAGVPGARRPAARDGAARGRGGGAHPGGDHTAARAAAQDPIPDLRAAAGGDLAAIVVVVKEEEMNQRMPTSPDGRTCISTCKFIHPSPSCPPLLASPVQTDIFFLFAINLSSSSFIAHRIG